MKREMKPETVKEFIAKHKLPVEFIEHYGRSAKTSEEAARVHKVPIEKIIKTLIFINKKGSAVVMILSGNQKVDLKKVPDMKDADLVTPEQLLELVGAVPGGVAPIGLPEEMLKYVDEGVMKLDEVYGAGGSVDTGIKFNPNLFLQLDNYFLINLVK